MEYGRRCRRVAAAKRIADIGIASVGIAVLVVGVNLLGDGLRDRAGGPKTGLLKLFSLRRKGK